MQNFNICKSNNVQNILPSSPLDYTRYGRVTKNIRTVKTLRTHTPHFGHCSTYHAQNVYTPLIDVSKNPLFMNTNTSILDSRKLVVAQPISNDVINHQIVTIRRKLVSVIL